MLSCLPFPLLSASYIVISIFLTFLNYLLVSLPFFNTQVLLETWVKMFTQLSTGLKLELVVPVQIHMTVILYVYKIWRLLFMSYELTWERDGRIATITAYEGTTLHRKLMNKLSQVDSSLHSQLHCPCLYLVLLALLLYSVCPHNPYI